MGSLANIEDPNEMQHNAAFHQGLHCLLILKQSSGTEIHHNLENSYCDPLKYTIAITYCINMYGKIHYNTKCSKICFFGTKVVLILVHYFMACSVTSPSF